MWTSKILGLLLLVTALTASPLPKDPEPLTSPPVETEEGTTISTELKPPEVPVEKDEKDEKPNAVVYLINLYAVKNITGESSDEIVNDDIIEHVPAMLEPVASVLLVVEPDDEEKPADLDEVAKEFEEEGFKIEKIAKDGETKVIKINLENPVEDVEEFLNKPTDLQKVRRKRTACLSCKLKALKGGYGGYGGYGGGYGGGYPGGGCGGGGCGGGGGQPIGVVVVPVQTGGGQYHKGGGGYYQPGYQQPSYQPPVYHPQQPTGYGCNTCGGGGGGYGHSQSSAQASAQSSSW